MDWNSSNNTFEFNDHCEPFLGNVVTWKLIIYLSVLVIAVIANILLLFAIYKDPLKCFRNPTTYFIANLAIADLLNSLVHTEEVLLSETTYISIDCFTGTGGTIHIATSNFIYFLAFPAVAVLALERYIAYPFWHQVNVTVKLCYIWIAIVWLVNCIYTGIFSAYTAHVDIVITAYPVLCYLATVLIYLLAFISIRKQRFSLVTDVTKSDSVKRMMKLRLKKKKHFLTTVLIINVVLVFGIIPTVIGSHFMFKSDGTIKRSSELVLPFTVILFFLNMAANPFLYIWRLPKYRRTFFVMYCCKK